MTYLLSELWWWFIIGLATANVWWLIAAKSEACQGPGCVWFKLLISVMLIAFPPTILVLAWLCKCK